MSRVITMEEVAASYGLNGLSIPAKGEVWKHHSGRLYRIDGLRNTAHPSDKFPIQVCYTQVDSGSEWARPLDDWHRSFGANAVPVDTVPYFTYDASTDGQDLWGHYIRKRPVISVQADGKKSIGMGLIVAIADSQTTAKIITEVLNEAFPPNPNEPKD